MYDSQEVAFTIKQLAKNRNVKIKKMLADCELSINTLSTMQAGGSYPRMETIVKIAEYLNCSIDYLLGRTGDPNPTFTNVGNNNKGNQAIHGNVTVSQPQETDNRDLQLLQMIQELSPVDYARVVFFINEIKNKEV